MAAWRIQQNFDALVRLHALSTGTSNARHPIHPRVPHRLFGFSAMTISWEILISQNALRLGQRWEMMRVASIQFYKISDDLQVLVPQLAHWFCMKLARGATLKPSAWSGMEWRWRPCNSCTINHLKSQVKYFLSSLHFFVWIILNRFLENPFFFSGDLHEFHCSGNLYYWTKSFAYKTLHYYCIPYLFERKWW